jgi:hypothetical protein
MDREIYSGKKISATTGSSQLQSLLIKIVISDS